MLDNEDALTPLPAPVGRWIAAFNAHDLATIVSLYRDDAELFDSGMPRPRHGHTEIERWFRWRFASTPITYIPTGEDPGENGQVIVAWIARGSGPRLLSRFTRSFEVAGKSYFTLSDGVIKKQHGVYDHLSVLRQVVPLFKWLPSRFTRFIYHIYLWRGGQ